MDKCSPETTQGDYLLLKSFFDRFMRKPSVTELMGLGDLGVGGRVYDVEDPVDYVEGDEFSQWVYDPQSGLLEHHREDGSFTIFEIRRVA